MKIVAALSILALSCQLAAQNAPRERSNFALDKTVVAALSFQQGNLASFKAAQANFTPKGWDEFIKTMQGFLDPNGAPTFTSRFVPAGPAVITSDENGSISGKVPGTLTQTHDKSTTTYRLRIEVQTTGTPPKINHLEQITCLGASAAKYCM
jgi:hypothetical protein